VPVAALKACRRTGCPGLTRGRFCERHAQEEASRVAAEDNRPSASQRGYNAIWRALRAAQLRRHPFCRIHGLLGVNVRATEVDHILSLAAGGSSRPENLQSLCHSCHASKTATVDGGFGHVRA
jgi:5-methylcytosine-specific restriction enzyme A